MEYEHVNQKVYQYTLRGLEKEAIAELDDTYDLNAEDVNGQTLLFIAIMGKLNKLCNIILEKGANVSIQNKYGQTPLFFAAIIDNIEIFKKLIEFGADINHRDVHNRCCMYYALTNNSVDVCKYLTKQAHFKINTDLILVYYYLLLATRNVNYDLVEIALEVGYDPFYRFNLGTNAFDYARLANIEDKFEKIIAKFDTNRVNNKLEIIQYEEQTPPEPIGSRKKKGDAGKKSKK